MYLKNERYSIDFFSKSKLEYNQDKNGAFHHNFKKDLQFIILWENGRKKEDRVFKELSRKFKILHCSEISWSQNFQRANFNRLYSQLANSDSNLKKHKIVGMGSFLCIVFEDLNPKYEYLKSLSGDVFLGNVNAVNMKYKLRNLLGDNLVHGTAGINEFFHHGSLIYHEKLLMEIISIKKWDGNIHDLKQDFAGAKGWASLNTFIKTVNLSCDWLILTNENVFKSTYLKQEISIICDDLDLFVSVSNAKKDKKSIGAYNILIDGEIVNLNIRYVGDNYYDPVWQYQMLERKVRVDNIPVLRNDDYFFSLLYSSKLQNKNVEEDKVKHLIKLGEEIGLKELKKDDIENDEKAISILNGFLNEKGYYFYIPYDKNVILNKKAYKYISAKPINNKTKIKSFLLNVLAKKTPKFIKNIIPDKLKSSAKKGL